MFNYLIKRFSRDNWDQSGMSKTKSPLTSIISQTL